MVENACRPVANDASSRPLITGLSPKEGVPGTQIKIRGENLGRNQSDLVALSICGTDCLISAKWKSPSLIIARVGQAKRGVGEVVLLTKSMGKSISNVTFRVFIVPVGPLEESAVWVDETRTVPGREAVRNVAEATVALDALGLTVEPHKKMDQTSLMQMFPEGSGNLRMENFNPAWYLLENHRETKLSDLKKGLMYLTQSTQEGEKSNSDLHRANLCSLINCVDALSELHDKMQLERSVHGWPLTKKISEKVVYYYQKESRWNNFQLAESHTAANAIFHEVLARKDRADATRNALSVLTRFRFIFFLSSAIDQNLAKGEYSTILNDYTRAKSLFKDTEVPLFKEVMADLDQKIEVFKKNMKQRLIDMPTSFEDQNKLIKYLKILEPDSDPAWDCITAYHCWLEDLLWQTQGKHLKLALDQVNNKRNSSGLFSLVEENSHNLHDFVQEMVDIITDKLQIFWKLSQVYTSSVANQASVDRLCDINQMLINTINVSSWLILNSLVPDALPEPVLKKYSEQFAKWPPIASSLVTHQLFSSLKILRSCVSNMLDSNFTPEQLQPLLELCVTIRLKCLSKVIEKVTQGVIGLGDGEIWELEYTGMPKTILPDLYETEVTDSMGQIRQILSFSHYTGELDLFSRERFRSMLIDLFTVILTSVRDCVESALKLRDCGKRPSALLNDGMANSRKLLIAVCNIEYITGNSLSVLCRRLAENGVKYGDIIFEEISQILQKSKDELLLFRQNLMKYYLQIKCAALNSMFGSANYDDLPDEDASDYIKEFVMYLIFIQSEICLLAPHLIREVLSPIIQDAFHQLIDRLSRLQNMSLEQTTQIVIDVTALEESVQNFLLLETRTVVNSFRAKFVNSLDQSHFQQSLRNFRAAMRMAIASLNCDQTDDSSDV